MNNTFPSFQHLVDRAIMTENMHREMEEKKEKKRKHNSSSSGSNSCPRFTGQQPHYQSRFSGGQYSPGQRYNNQGPRPNPHGQPGAPQQSTRQGAPATRQNAATGTPMKTATPTPSNGCFTCGDPNHWARQCHTRMEVSPSQLRMLMEDRSHLRHQQRMATPVLLQLTVVLITSPMPG